MSKIKDPELAAQLAIITVVGLAAGAASFTHVHDWTMANSPAGTPGWFGWANAVISELVPIASLLTIRRNRRIGKPIGMPVFMLLAAATLSLAAQLAVAKPSASGWLLSAVPALAFMGLMKMVLAGLPAAVPIADSVPVHKVADADFVPVTPLPVVPVADVVPMPISTPADQHVADSVPVTVPVEKPAESAKKPRTRKPVVPAHPEKRADRNDAEILDAYVLARADGKKIADIAKELGVSERKLFNIRKTAGIA
ncbi:helix-turn-helix domain containing protein [Micromonospora sp. WMMD718]|uniref:helix-turn-helix domain-containing protein n=1 Tax=unclassified Micromonospora TaxID=2617518 RepID=UPI000A5AB2AD|nr:MULTISPECIES: helix-turn-helix domain-containing protein [unclassified Micromonospora]MDG4750633.1 helix-turn-helix domain containing protein [Micromonospora sp. WMMD718]